MGKSKEGLMIKLRGLRIMKIKIEDSNGVEHTFDLPYEDAVSKSHFSDVLCALIDAWKNEATRLTEVKDDMHISEREKLRLEGCIETHARCAKELEVLLSA